MQEKDENIYHVIICKSKNIEISNDHQSVLFLRKSVKYMPNNKGIPEILLFSFS